MTTDRVKKVQFDLENSDGNAFAIMGGWRRAARKQGWTEEEVAAVLNEAQSGDYDHLLQTIIKHTDL